MPMPRLYGGTFVRSRPSSDTVPVSGRMKPPMMRSVVVLPDPDGPSRVTNSPGATSSETSSTA